MKPGPARRQPAQVERLAGLRPFLEIEMPNPTDPAYTPWGKADHEKVHAEGIVFHGTPSHGGFKLSAERLARMHPALRETDGWFEEDRA